MALDVNLIRQMESEVNGIPLCDDTLTFYYDETGNCGKFILTADGVNDKTALTNDFILGGIMYKGEVCTADTAALLKDIRLSAKAKELKFDKVYTDTADPDGKGDAQTFNGAPTVLGSIVGNAIENPGDAWHKVIGETPMLQVRVNVVADIDGDGSSATQEDLNALKIHLLGVEDKTNTDVNRDRVTDICDLVMLKKICG